MKYIVGAVLGFIVAFIVLTFCNAKQNNKLLDKYYDERQQNRELRSIVQDIEDILKASEREKENFFVTIQKIKKVLSNDGKSTK